MQFNLDSDGQDIVSLVGDATGINTTSDIKQITRAANRANKIIWSWIFESYGGWQHDDSNNANMPTVTAALVSGQQQYTLPSEALTVRAVERKDENGDWHKLEAITVEEISEKYAEAEFEDTAATPRWYSIIANILKLYPAADYAQAGSLRLHLDRGSVSFASTDTTQTPGFVSQFHEAVADGASYYIAKDKGLSNVQLLQDNWAQWENKIKLFYNKRFYDEFPHQLKKGDYSREII